MSVKVRIVAQVLPLQEQVDLPEIRPVGLVPLPALAHEIKDLFGAVDWGAQQYLKNITRLKIYLSY